MVVPGSVGLGSKILQESTTVLRMTFVDYNLPVQIPEELAADKPVIISQGAEALIFLVPQSNHIVKFRPPKRWRIPELDVMLRKRNIRQECRAMEKLRGHGIGVPRIFARDEALGILRMEHIRGKSLKEATWAQQVADGTVTPAMANYYRQFALEIAKMHELKISHGDLTTSNAIVTPEEKVVLIDFGLSSLLASEEEQAIDIYLMERAIDSTHPREAKELMNTVVMPTYIEERRKIPQSRVVAVLERLRKARMRGRKRTQLG